MIMKLFKRFFVVSCLWLALAPAQADILVSGGNGAGPQPAAILDQSAPRAQVLEQLIAGGVEPALARERVAALTDAEVNEVAGKMAELPAGAGISTMNLLLIIIILILLL